MLNPVKFSALAAATQASMNGAGSTKTCRIHSRKSGAANLLRAPLVSQLIQAL